VLSQSIFFIAADKVTRAPIGFIQAYNMAGLEGYTYVLSYFVEAARHTSKPGETGLIFGDYLFGFFNLRKIYADVFEYNHDSIRIVETLGFREEGRQREHVFYIDRFWDMIRYSLTRERWNELRERFHRLLIIREEAEELLAERPAPRR
jgi:RimJ/RimL family protein N-acetyltransferase